MQQSRLEYIHVAISELFYRGEILEDLLERYDNGTLGPAMASIDVAVLLSGLAAHGTYLRTVVLTMALRGQSVWSIDRVGKDKAIRRLDDYTARRLIEREEHP